MPEAKAVNEASGKVANKVVLNLGALPPKQNIADMKKDGQNATMSVRLPTILGKGIADVHQTLNQESDEDRITDLVACIHRMEDLMDDLTENSKLRPIIDDGAGDIPLWNKEIAKYFQGKDFMNAPWLFAEAYKYRRLRECFSLSKYWVEYDVFFRQKCDTFARSSTAVFELASRFAQPFKHEDGLTDELKLKANKLIFRELTQVCLWGNSTDLSLLIDMSEEDIKKLQSTGGEHLAATEKNILGNHLENLTDYVTSLKGGRIDFVLGKRAVRREGDQSLITLDPPPDNAGFELYCDFVYADWLIQSGICDQIVFHGKKFPWFVSDVTRKDWDCEASEAEMDLLRMMGRRWKQYEKEGKWRYEQHPFWCTGYTFWDLHSEAPDVFLDLHRSDLVIFKGDLNHRKLTYDCHVPYATSFAEAIGPMASQPGAPRVASLRTIKSDVVCGLPAGVGEKLDEDEAGWKISGKYAVILMSEGRPDEKVVFS
ncbi:hypothetical protein QFC20_004546 [Naganishia adeliensis]|uniref:Uncharacterized protein n=1 Tax=Naganishia adeliensis TaxID=92952 RepID=A0ACC2VY51_9TREE|nr:hypothetical protein QFC20_004546 [Naganishia adeliensis]